MEIRVDDLTGPEVSELLHEHLRSMASISPAESRHVLDLEGLRQSDVTFWSAWEGPNLVGCGALKHIDARHAEIKSMRTAPSHLRRGVATRMLEHLLAEAESRGYERVSLETGSMAAFEPARRLYVKFGFKYCDPFANYRLDPNSVFMTKSIGIRK